VDALLHLTPIVLMLLMVTFLAGMAVGSSLRQPVPTVVFELPTQQGNGCAVTAMLVLIGTAMVLLMLLSLRPYV